MQAQRTTQPGIYDRSRAAILRAAATGCAAMLVLLLLTQPLLCVIHCALRAHAAAIHSSSGDPFLCHTAAPTDAPAPLVPAFWPGILPVLIVLAVSFRRHTPSRRRLFRPIAHLWAPPIPPPRLVVA